MTARRLALTGVVAVLIALALAACGRQAAQKRGTKAATSAAATDRRAALPSEPGAKPGQGPGKPAPGLTADEVLAKMASAYRSARTLQLDAVAESVRSMGAEKGSSQQQLSLHYARPNKIKLVRTTGRDKMMVVSNGRQVYMYVGQQNMYQKAPAPKTAGEVSGSTGRRLDTPTLLDGVNIRNLVKNPKLVASENLRGVETYVIAYTPTRKMPGGVIASERLWIGKKDYLIRQMSSRETVPVDVLSKLPNAPKNISGPLVMSQTITARKITINSPIPASTFQFTPPQGAREVQPPSVQPKEITGEKAPAFSIPSLDGKIVSLSDYKGRPVLVVFWSVLSGTAKEGMVQLQKLHEQLRGSGPAILGVNLDGDKAAVTKYVDESKIAFPILFGRDKAMAAATAYSGGRMGLPGIFVVGADGTIKGKIVDFRTAAAMKAELDKLGVK